jgi:putative heme-binding domain-containing protein
MNVISARPQHDTFGIANAMLIAPGDSARSILYQRLSRRGRGQMPPVAINSLDEKALALFRDWISGMKTEQNFVREWTMDDLLPLLAQTKSGRSFSSGRAAFTQVGCGQCHKFASEGGSVGPELTGVGSRLSLHDVLESIVLPSKVVAEGYAATDIETASGDIVTGRIVREDDQIVVVLPQTAIADTTSVRKSDIRRRELSKVSNMPAGILNTLKTNQILDLLAYLISDGNSNHVAFLAGEPQSHRSEQR